jgi:hypothetical protein
MVNKSKRNKIKFRSTRKIYKGGKTNDRPQEVKTKKPWMYADLPNVSEENIRNIGFEIPTDQGFKSDKDYYKFLEMADRDLTLDMQNKLNKYESNGGVGANYCKYMYLIRATHPKSGNTVLHYICNRRSVEMLKIVFPYYLVLYNAAFPELLSYYINKKNSAGKTPMELLNVVGKNWTSAPMDYGRRLVSAVGTIKNATQVTSRVRRLGNMSVSGRVEYIKGVLTKFSVRYSVTQALPSAPPSYGSSSAPVASGSYGSYGSSSAPVASGSSPASVKKNGFFSGMFGKSSKQPIPATKFKPESYIGKKYIFIYENEKKSINLGKVTKTYSTGLKNPIPAHTTILFKNDQNKTEYKVRHYKDSNVIVLTEEIISKNQSKLIIEGNASEIFFQEI